MGYALKEIAPGAYREWFTDSLRRLRLRGPFHQPAWLEAVAAGTRFEVRVIGVYEGTTLVGAVPGFMGRWGPFRIFGSPMRGTMTSYLGPVGGGFGENGSELLDLVGACADFARRKWGVTYASFTLRDFSSDDLPGPGWVRETPGSYRGELSSNQEELWARLESDCRRNIRKARKVGIETVPLEDLDLFYRMLGGTLERHGGTVWHSERFFKALVAGLVPCGLMTTWAARYDGRTIAAGLFLLDDQEIHFLSGASFTEYGNLPTSYLIHWQAMEAAAGRGLQVFNSDASRVRSIDQFKEAFGLKLNRRLTLTWAPEYVHQAYRLLIPAYQRLRRAHSRITSRRAGAAPVRPGAKA